PASEQSGGRERTTPPVTTLPADKSSQPPVTGLRSGTLTTPGRPEAVPELQDNTELPGGMSVGSETRREVQNDLFGGNPVVTGQTENPDSAGEWQFKSDVNSSALISAFGEQDESSISSVSSVAFAATGLEP